MRKHLIVKERRRCGRKVGRKERWRERSKTRQKAGSVAKREGRR